LMQSIAANDYAKLALNGDVHVPRKFELTSDYVGSEPLVIIVKKISSES
jgi:hypothetical protein